MKIVITCGGTGGHIYPALAIAEEFGQNEVNFIGSSNRLENKIIPGSGYKLHAIKTSRNNPISIIVGFFQSLRLLLKLKPDFVISTGGYVTLPVCLAAILLGKKIILQEQNTIPGKVNKLISNFAYKICIGFPIAKEGFPRNKTILTGIPVRKKIIEESKQEDNKETPIDKLPDNKNILVIGGSQGAVAINQIITDFVKESKELSINFILIAGQNNYLTLTGNLKLEPTCKLIEENNRYTHLEYRNGINLLVYSYIDNIHIYMKKSDLVIARAGASTLAELSITGKASILVPYPYAADNHQEYNAKYFVNKGAAQMVIEEELSSSKLKGIIDMLINTPQKVEEMASKAALISKTNSAQVIAKITAGS